MARVRMDESFDRAYDRVMEAADDALETTANEELEASEDAYDQEETVLGTPWKPLSPVTIAKKGHDTILVEEGDMRESGYVDKRTGESAVNVGYSDWKVAIHEYGTENIPPRPIIEPMRIDLKENTMLDTMREEVRESLLYR